MKINWISKSKVGFRISLVDIIFIILAFLVFFVNPFSWFLDYGFDDFLRFLVPYIVFNFFLFCNVFRVRTIFELLWVTIAFCNAFLCLFSWNGLGFVDFFIYQSLVTVVVIFMEISSESYHGIFAKKKASKDA